MTPNPPSNSLETTPPSPPPDIPDPTYGYTAGKLLQVCAPPNPPADFADFWQETYAAARSIPTNSTIRQIPSPDPSFEVFEVDYDSIDGFRTGGWLTSPVGIEPIRGIVTGHGYGGRTAPDFSNVGAPAVRMFPCARGFHRSASPRFPDVAAQHVIHGITSRDTYLHRGCAAEIWSAASVLEERFPTLAGRLHYIGGSFGGGIGALAIPWEPRFVSAHLDVPSFGNHPLRVTLPCLGSGESVRMHYLEHPESLKVLAYFDAATASTFTKTPTLVSAALADSAVPPPGQFAVFNALQCPKQLFTRSSGHPDRPEESEQLAQVLSAWFAAHES